MGIQLSGIPLKRATWPQDRARFRGYWRWPASTSCGNSGASCGRIRSRPMTSDRMPNSLGSLGSLRMPCQPSNRRPEQVESAVRGDTHARVGKWRAGVLRCGGPTGSRVARARETVAARGRFVLGANFTCFTCCTCLAPVAARSAKFTWFTCPEPVQHDPTCPACECSGPVAWYHGERP